MGKSRQVGPTNWAACTEDKAVYMVPGTTMEIPRFASVSSAAIQGARHPVGRRAGNENGADCDGSLRPKGVQSLASKTFANSPLAFSIYQQGDPDGSRIL